MIKFKYDLERFKKDLKSSTAIFLIDLAIERYEAEKKLYFDEAIALATLQRTRLNKPQKMYYAKRWAEYLRDIKFIKYNKNFGTARYNTKFFPKNQFKHLNNE
jgi:hypothetical protein